MNSEQHEAEIAAEQDAKTDVNKLVWICAGLFGNIIGILVAYIYQPTPLYHGFLKSRMCIKCFIRIPTKPRYERYN